MPPINLLKIKRTVDERPDARKIFVLSEGTNTEPGFIEKILTNSGYGHGGEYTFIKVEKTWNSLDKLMKQFDIPFEKTMGCMIYALKYDCGIEIPLKNVCGIDVGLIQKSIPVYQKEMVKCFGMALAGGLVYLLADSLSKDW